MNTVVCTNFIHKVIEFFNLTAFNWFQFPQLFLCARSLLEIIDESNHRRCHPKQIRDVAVMLSVNYLVNYTVE